MILSYITGRLGNQLFEYAYARSLLLKRGKNEELILNFSLVRVAGKEIEGFDDNLRYFNVYSYTELDKDIVLNKGDLLQLFIYILFKLDQKLFRIIKKEKWFSFFRRFGIIFQDYLDNISNLIIPRTKNVFCYGKYENPKYFDDIRSILLKEFTPRTPPLKNNDQLYSVIESTNSVCISIRRGDFLCDKFKDRFLVCDKEYFLEAMEEAKKRISNSTFIFFSDDIEWVRENIHSDVPCYYESGKDPVWEKLRLMYSCKHFIISNSTFSWWAQYLSRNEEKVVIAPDRWSNVPGEKSFLLSNSFIKIPIGILP